MKLLAIDPGNIESAYVVVDTADLRPIAFGKVANDVLIKQLDPGDFDHAVIEMIASYGMAVGAEVFDTCVWIGRYRQMLIDCGLATPTLVKRQAVRMHLCHNGRLAKDGNVRQALVDRFASGEKNSGKGTKAEPGWFHGFAADVWAAYALAVYTADTMTLEESWSS